MKHNELKPFIRPALFDVPNTSFKMKMVTTAFEGMTVSYLRALVFMLEQHIDIHDEFDGSDAYAVSFLMFDDAKPIGTIRYYKDDKGRFHLGRLALLESYRGKGFGKAMVVWMHQYLKTLFTNGTIILHAQAYLIPFYKGLGYKEEGNRFDEAGISHQVMTLTL
jgi:ElaA protein